MTKLPRGWAEARLGELANAAYGKSLANELRTDKGEFAYVGSGGPIANTQARLVESETIVVGRKGTAGSVQRYAHGCWPSDTTFYVVVPGEIDGRLLELQLRAAQLGQHDRSTALPGLGRADLEAASIVVPPAREQARIVVAIEEAFSRVDAGESALRAVRQRLARMRDSVLAAAVAGGLVPQDPSELPAATMLEHLEIAPSTVTKNTPQGWAWTTLGAVFEVAVGSTPSRKDPSLWGGGIPWVSSGEVAFARIRSTRETIAPSVIAGRPGRLAPPGTVMLAMIGEGKTRGQPAILDIAAAHNQNCASIRVSETGISSEWVYVVLAARYQETRRSGSGNNQQALNKRLVEQIELPLAPRLEQDRIVAEVDRMLSFVSTCEGAVDQVLARSRALRRAVLKSAFEGKLVPQDPSDEPASVLLERIASEPKKVRKH